VEQLTFSRSEVEDLAGHYSALARRIPLHPIETDAAYDAAVGVLNGLLDAGAGDEDHPLAPLVDLLGAFVEAYDGEHHRLPPGAPGEVIRLLMDQHGLKQADLPEIGSQGVVSEILGGRRSLNVNQIRRLAERFQVSPATFF
jgi:HTH-type transcriptional regulator / antitoxin HigA